MPPAASGSRPVRRSRRVALLAYGTRGDIQPMLAVADELDKRGHSVAITVNRNLADWATGSGLEVIPTEPDVQAFLSSPGGQSMLADGRLTAFAAELARVEASVNQQIMAASMRCCEGADIILSTIVSSFRASAIAEATGIAHGVLLTMPFAPTAAYPQVLAPIRRLPSRALNRWSHQLMLWLWWRSIGKTQPEVRALLGLPAVANRPTPECIRQICLYSPLLSPRPADWRHDQLIAGSTVLSDDLRARLGESGLSAELQRWLDQGDAPIFFGFGSMPVADPSALIEQVRCISRDLGRRALIGAGWSHYRQEPSDQLCLASHFDHDAALPRCRAAARRFTMAALGRPQRPFEPACPRWCSMSSPTRDSGAGACASWGWATASRSASSAPSGWRLRCAGS